MSRWTARVGTVVVVAALFSHAAADDPARAARALVEKGSFAEAERAARAFLEQAERAGAGDSLDAARQLDTIVRALVGRGRGDAPETLELAERALAIKERRPGTSDEEIATSLLGLAETLGLAEPDRTDALLSRALALREAALGPETPEVAEASEIRARFLLLQGNRLGEASSLLERALAIREADAERAEGALGNTLHLLSQARVAQGDLEGGLLLAQRGLEIRERVFGPDHFFTGDSLMGVGQIRLLLHRYDALVPILERAAAIRERRYGEEHPATLAAWNNLALGLQAGGRIGEARAVYERRLAVIERTVGLDDPAAATALQNLGALCLDTGRFEEARRHFARVVEIREAAGATDLGLARDLNNLAFATKVLGELSEARNLYARSFELFERARGPDHPDVATNLTMFANLLRNLGELSEARTSLERALRIRRKTLGEEDRMTGHTHAGLGELLWDLGDLDRARIELEQAAGILERGRDVPDADRVYVDTQLGRLLVEAGRPAAGERWLRAASALDEESPMTLAALAELHRERGELGEAERLHRQALAARESRYGTTHPDVATSLLELGQILVAEGRAEEAGRLFERALTIRRERLGAEHPDVGAAWIALATTRRIAGDFEGALDAALDGERIVREHLRVVLRSLEERQALHLASRVSRGLDLALSILEGHPSPQATRRVWDAVIASRALVLDELASRNAWSRAIPDPEIARLVKELATARADLAYVTFAAPEERQADTNALSLARATRRRDAAERALAVRSAPFRRELSRSATDLPAIASALGEGTAVVAWVAYDRSASPGGNATPAYAAFTRSASGRLRFVPLADADEVVRRVERWRAAAAKKPPPGPAAARRAEAQYRDAAAELRRLVWDPLREAVGPAERIVLVPDGALQVVSFGSLPDDEGGYLVEDRVVLHPVSAERDLRPANGAAHGRGMLVVGDPEFERTTSDAPVRGSDCVDLRTLKFASLPQSREEVERIGELWSAGGEPLVRLLGPDASEGALRQAVSGKRVVHLATHGFFLGGACRSALEAPGARQATGENPLLLSGLVLAGANDRAGTAGDRDGILTAEELASLDLEGVEWVVLSACDTGLGEPRRGEGLLGLRRAIEISGARSSILSLWRVQDDAAREWMVELYRARHDASGAADAVRRASAAVIARRRAAGRSTHPFYWGAFVGSGAD